MFQLGSALLDGCVLAVLSGSDAYGYSLTQSIKQTIDVSESTLYPVLRRLQKDGLLETYDQPHNGRNRRYYRLTAAGAARLAGTVQAWKTFKAQVDALLTTPAAPASSATPATPAAPTTPTTTPTHPTSTEGGERA
jgi:PadR family transcriptional regulator PadR